MKKKNKSIPKFKSEEEERAFWAQNDSVGLIDWEHTDVGDPHWDFRMIRRWLGWDGLEELLFHYNANTGLKCRREYIEVLDKISLCNSRQIRSFTDPLFNEYIKVWPSIPHQKF